jgi:hypothetical protein
MTILVKSLATMLLLVPCVPSACAADLHVIDRQALVARHRVILKQADPLTPLSVGNGEFAFTADITGLQTFPEFHEQGMPLGTQSQWGWHQEANPNDYQLPQIMATYDVGGRTVPYASGQVPSGGYTPGAMWLRSNPHRLHLGQIGLRLIRHDGKPARLTDIEHPVQTLDLWTGILCSRFLFQGEAVEVKTVCHPRQDTLAIEVSSGLLQQARLAVRVTFPGASTDWRRHSDWDHPERHVTRAVLDDSSACFERILDADRYHARMHWNSGGTVRTVSPHTYELTAPSGEVLRMVTTFSRTKLETQPLGFAQVETAACQHWRNFWMSGAAIDFSRCTDPRAPELERRVVLSQYLTAIQCAGSLPPQETGLVCNSWHGKFHLEMHWWHAVHFALWDRLPLLERSLAWYQSILPAATATATFQGYQGARWPKMTSPTGRESPSSVGVFLIWQQPHPIYYAELCYRKREDRATLEQYRDVVFASAEFMASYPRWDDEHQRFVLGPALIPAQESYGRDRRRNLNPTFELAYWYWGLETAQRWRQRLGLPREPHWDRILHRLSRPTVRDGVYTGIETEPYTIYRDHPSMVAAYGVLPATPQIKPDVMKATLTHVMETWDWASTWGWDYPMLAMTAARVGEPERAVDALFMDSPKNRYLANGHNFQTLRLPLYLPGNGGLLTAVAMMAAGWDGGGEGTNPGFPDDGSWEVHWEGLRPMP